MQNNSTTVTTTTNDFEDFVKLLQDHGYVLQERDDYYIVKSYEGAKNGVVLHYEDGVYDITIGARGGYSLHQREEDAEEAYYLIEKLL